MATQARELISNPRLARPYTAANPSRIRHDALWHQANLRWRPGRRVWIETKG